MIQSSRKSWRLLWTVLFAQAAYLFVSNVALAQRLSTELSARQVEVGETFVVQLTALVDDESSQPQNPALKLPPGIVATGPNLSTQQQVSIVNGRLSRSYGVTATWSVTPTKVGRYPIGPASILIQGRRLSDDAQSIEVVAAGTARQQPQRGARGFPFGFDPFDPFGSGPLSNRLRGLPTPDPDAEEPELDPSSVPEEWRVARAPDPAAFLIAKVSPRKVVVGQALSLKVFAYTSYPGFDDVSASDVTRKEFLAFDLATKDQSVIRRVPIGNQLFNAAQIRDLLLVPLASGRFKVGEMTMKLALISRRGQEVVERQSVPAEIEVVEPPKKGRPPGYRLGDVGHFQLKVEVAPREVPVGGAVSVTAWLEGQGNFPSELRLPEQKGVEFSQPTLKEEIAPKEGALAGYRKFSYVVRLNEAGELDLGALAHPYFNPSAGYETASVALGLVKAVAAVARPGAPEPALPAAAPPSPLQRIAELMKPRADMLGQKALRAATAPSDQRWFYPLLLLGPALVVLGQFLGKFGAAVSTRQSARKGALAYQARVALEEARDLAKNGSMSAVSALERAVFLALEDRTGLKARAVLRGQLASKLTSQGFPSELAARAVELLEQGDTVRFGILEAELQKLVADTGAWLARALEVQRSAS